MVAAARILIIFLAACGLCPLTAISERIPRWLDVCTALFRTTLAVAYACLFMMTPSVVNDLQGKTFQVTKQINYHYISTHLIVSYFSGIFDQCSLFYGGLPDFRVTNVSCNWSVFAKITSPSIRLSICVSTVLPLHHDDFFIWLPLAQPVSIVEPHRPNLPKFFTCR